LGIRFAPPLVSSKIGKNLQNKSETPLMMDKIASCRHFVVNH